MTLAFDLVLWDIGGVLGSNGWDHEQRAAAVKQFGLDKDDFEYRHHETVGVFESGELSLDEYLDVTVFCTPRDFTREDFKTFMFAQSVPWPDSIAIAREIAEAGVRIATLNNESEALNVHRIKIFGLCEIFPVFFSSCWLGVRKPTQTIYKRVLGMTQIDPKRVIFVDDRDQNLAPAAALGMTTIRFESAEQLRSAFRAQRLLGE